MPHWTPSPHLIVCKLAWPSAVPAPDLLPVANFAVEKKDVPKLSDRFDHFQMASVTLNIIWNALWNSFCCFSANVVDVACLKLLSHNAHFTSLGESGQVKP